MHEFGLDLDSEPTLEEAAHGGEVHEIQMVAETGDDGRLVVKRRLLLAEDVFLGRTAHLVDMRLLDP